MQVICQDALSRCEIIVSNKLLGLLRSGFGFGTALFYMDEITIRISYRNC